MELIPGGMLPALKKLVPVATKFIHRLENWTTSAHQEISCFKCHGTALKSGWHSFSEKTKMVFSHVKTSPYPEDVRMSENQIFETMQRCTKCHQDEFANWKACGHSATYEAIFYGRAMQNSSIAYYSRHEKTHFDLNNLPVPVILSGGDTIQTPAGPVYKLCVQCHAPSVWHQLDSSDDNTPAGVHEGISCRACHAPHSNYQRNSCEKCHQGVSNCGIDVQTMNTTFLSPASENNIRTVACKDCHPEMKESTTKTKTVKLELNKIQ